MINLNQSFGNKVVLLAATKLDEPAFGAAGPFREFRFRTILTPSVLDKRPELLERAREMGVGRAARRTGP